MEPSISSVLPRLKKAQPFWRQIMDHYAERIANGELAPGDALPTTTQMAAEFGVTVNTIQQGIASLARRGLVERFPSRGTFVSPGARSRDLGVVFGVSALVNPDAQFYLSLHGHLTQAARRCGWNFRTYMPADEADVETIGADILRDTREGRLRGLLYLAHGVAMADWLQSHEPVPWTPFTGWCDYGALVAAATKRLFDGGVRRPMLIAPDDDQRRDCQAAFRSSGATGSEDPVIGVANSEAGGVEIAHRLVSTPPERRPDGLVVGDDNACRGLIAGLLGAGIPVPGPIRIVTHANRGIAVFPGIDVTRLEFDPQMLATAVVDDLVGALEGREAVRVPFKPVFVPGSTG